MPSAKSRTHHRRAAPAVASIFSALAVLLLWATPGLASEACPDYGAHAELQPTLLGVLVLHADARLPVTWGGGRFEMVHILVDGREVAQQPIDWTVTDYFCCCPSDYSTELSHRFTAGLAPGAQVTIDFGAAGTATVTAPWDEPAHEVDPVDPGRQIGIATDTRSGTLRDPGADCNEPGAEARMLEIVGGGHVLDATIRYPQTWALLRPIEEAIVRVNGLEAARVPLRWLEIGYNCCCPNELFSRVTWPFLAGLAEGTEVEVDFGIDVARVTVAAPVGDAPRAARRSPGSRARGLASAR